MRQMRSLVESGLSRCASKALASGTVRAGAIEHQVLTLVSVALLLQACKLPKASLVCHRFQHCVLSTR